MNNREQAENNMNWDNPREFIFEEPIVPNSAVAVKVQEELGFSTDRTGIIDVVKGEIVTVPELDKKEDTSKDNSIVETTPAEEVKTADVESVSEREDVEENPVQYYSYAELCEKFHKDKLKRRTRLSNKRARQQRTLQRKRAKGK